MSTQAGRHPTRGLTEGAILAALTAVAAAVGLVAPFVGVLLAPLPIMLLVIRWGLRTALLASIVATVLILEFFGPLNAVSAVAGFAPLGLALGWGIRRGLSAQLTILTGAAAFLVSALGALALATAVLHQDLVGQFIRTQTQAMQTALAFQQRLGAPASQIEDLRKVITIMPQFLRTTLPAMFALGALVWAYFSYIIARAVLRRIGYTLPSVPPILAWRLPPALVSALLWAAAGVSIASLRDPRLNGAALDAMIIALFVFGFQGALVGFAWMNNRQVPRFIQVLAVLFLLGAGLLPLLALAALGVLDTWFDYRRLTRPAAAPATEVPAPEGGTPRGNRLPGRGAEPDKPTAKAGHPR